MILTKEVETNVSGRNKQYYLDKGYSIPLHKDRNGRIVVQKDTKIKVKVSDLPPKSYIQVVVQCDGCGITKEMAYEAALKYSHDGKNYCQKCNRELFKKTMIEKYGVDNPSRLESAKEKRTQTFVLHYGVENPFQSKEIQEKIKQTNLEKYDAENPFASRIIQEKIKQTNLEKYGYEHVSSSPEIREKINSTLLSHGRQKASSQQKYLSELYNGEVNYLCDYYFMDIFLKDEKIDIEVDFGGHDLCVKTGKMSKEEFDRKELVREIYIRSKGIKIIRLISPNNKLPSDKILLDILEFAKQYLLNSKHTWIYFYLNENKYRNAEHRDNNGAFYDFGELWDTRKLVDLYRQEEVNDVA